MTCMISVGSQDRLFSAKGLPCHFSIASQLPNINCSMTLSYLWLMTVYTVGSCLK